MYSDDERLGLESSKGLGALEKEASPPQRRAKHRKGAGAGIILSKKVLERNWEKAKEPPEFFCALCCQLLFESETYPLHLSNAAKSECECRSQEVRVAEGNRRFSVIRDVPWPCRNYNKEPTMKKGNITTCKAHEKATLKTLDHVGDLLFLFGGELHSPRNLGASTGDPSLANQNYHSPPAPRSSSTA